MGYYTACSGQGLILFIPLYENAGNQTKEKDLHHTRKRYRGVGNVAYCAAVYIASVC